MFGRKSGVLLSEFVRGVVKALTDAQQALPDARRERFSEHMTETGENEYEANFHTVKISDDESIRLATYSLDQVNTIGITEAEIDCCCKITGMDKETGHAIFHVQPTNRGRDTFEMRLKFASREPSETEMHLIEALDRISDV